MGYHHSSKQIFEGIIQRPETSGIGFRFQFQNVFAEQIQAADLEVYSVQNEQNYFLNHLEKLKKIVRFMTEKRGSPFCIMAAIKEGTKWIILWKP